jgi:predicted glycosyltransferase
MKPDLLMVKALVLAITAPDEEQHKRCMTDLVFPLTTLLKPDEIEDCKKVAEMIVGNLTQETPKIVMS